MSSAEIKALINEEMAYYDLQPNPIKVVAFAKELEGMSIQDLRHAVSLFRSQPGRRQMPMPADYKSVIPDGHLTAQESWALIPKNEGDSIVWTEEMRKAFAVCYPFLKEGDHRTAWFGYKETYEREIVYSRSMGYRPKWTLSPGHDLSGRDAAVAEAVDKKRISLETAVGIHPELVHSPRYEQLYLAHKGEQLQLPEPMKQEEKKQKTDGFVSAEEALKSIAILKSNLGKGK